MFFTNMPASEARMYDAASEREEGGEGGPRSNRNRRVFQEDLEGPTGTSVALV